MLARLVTATVAVLWIVPNAASAEYCVGPTHTSTEETATDDVPVTVGRSIGPIAVGMTRTQISRVVGLGVADHGMFRWNVSGIRVLVTFGRYG